MVTVVTVASAVGEGAVPVTTSQEHVCELWAQGRHRAGVNLWMGPNSPKFCLVLPLVFHVAVK